MAVDDRDSSWPFNTYPNSRLKAELMEVQGWTRLAHVTLVPNGPARWPYATTAMPDNS